VINILLIYPILYLRSYQFSVVIFSKLRYMTLHRYLSLKLFMIYVFFYSIVEI